MANNGDFKDSGNGRTGKRSGRKEAPKTFKQRSKEVARVSSTVPQGSDGIITDLKRLSELMEETCSITPLQPPVVLPINASGYVDVCSEVYNSVVTLNPSLAQTLSEPEYLMAASWLLVDRSLTLRTEKMYATLPGQYDFHSSLESIREVPTPISYYLSHFGAVTPPNSRVVVPQVILPFDNPVDNQVGMEPGSPDDGYTSYSRDHFAMMLPFGSWKRGILHASQNGTFAGGGYNTVIDRGGQHVNNAIYQHLGVFPKINGFSHMTPERQASFEAASFTTFPAHDIRRQICFSSEIMRKFLLFNQRASNLMALSQIPRGLQGSMAILTQVAPVGGNQDNRPVGFTFQTPFLIDMDAVIASRLFRFRQIGGYLNHGIQVGNAARNGQVAFVPIRGYETGLGQFDDINFEISALPDYRLLCSGFVAKFLKKKKNM